MWSNLDKKSDNSFSVVSLCYDIPDGTHRVFDYILDHIHTTLIWKWMSPNALLQTLYDKLLDWKVDDTKINWFYLWKNWLILQWIWREDAVITYEEILAQEVNLMVKKKSLQEREKRAENIQKAIQYIFHENKWLLWNDEINHDDILDTKEFWEDLDWLTLKGLQRMFDIEFNGLQKIYNIQWETQKQIWFIKAEIQYKVGIGDTYDWWARYFSMKSWNIQRRVDYIVEHSSYDELFTYINQLNHDLEDNEKTETIALEYQNKRCMEQLYETTFQRLEKEMPDSKYFLEFAKCITWRWKSIEYSVEKHSYLYNKYWLQPYESLPIMTEYKDVDLANRALMYVMYMEGGVISRVQDSIWEVDVYDPYVWKKEPSKVIAETFTLLSNNTSKGRLDWPKKLLKDAWLSSLIWTSKKYTELTFSEKVELWALARINKLLQKVKDRQKDKWAEEKLIEYRSLISEIPWLINESLEWANDSFSDHFDSPFLGFDWKTSLDLWLEGQNAEVFDLYQRLNWNEKSLQWSEKTRDKYLPWKGALTLWLWLAVWWYYFWPIFAAAKLGEIASAWTVFSAWAKTWAAVWALSVIFSGEAYATEEEAIVNALSQVSVDAVASWVFAMWWFAALQKAGNVAPDFISVSKASWLDKGIIWTEIWVTWFLVSPVVSSIVKRHFSLNNFDPDLTSYDKQLRLKQKRDNETIQNEEKKFQVARDSIGHILRNIEESRY